MYQFDSSQSFCIQLRFLLADSYEQQAEIKREVEGIVKDLQLLQRNVSIRAYVFAAFYSSCMTVMLDKKQSQDRTLMFI